MHQYFEDCAQYIINDIRLNNCPYSNLVNNLDELKEHVIKSVTDRFTETGKAAAESYIEYANGDFELAKEKVIDDYLKLEWNEKNEIAKQNIHENMNRTVHFIEMAKIIANPPKHIPQAEPPIAKKKKPIMFYVYDIILFCLVVLIAYLFYAASNISIEDEFKMARWIRSEGIIPASLYFLATIFIILFWVFMAKFSELKVEYNNKNRI